MRGTLGHCVHSVCQTRGAKGAWELESAPTPHPASATHRLWHIRHVTHLCDLRSLVSKTKAIISALLAAQGVEIKRCRD